MRYPKIIAAQRLQTWLLVTALVAVLLTGLLAADLARNLRSVVISDTNKALANAVGELVQSARAAASNRNTPFLENSDGELRRLSYEVLRSYPDIEGGFLWNDEVVGHSFPTYTEPGSALRQPPRLGSHPRLPAELADVDCLGEDSARDRRVPHP